MESRFERLVDAHVLIFRCFSPSLCSWTHATGRGHGRWSRGHRLSHFRRLPSLCAREHKNKHRSRCPSPSKLLGETAMHVCVLLRRMAWRRVDIAWSQAKIKRMQRQSKKRHVSRGMDRKRRAFAALGPVLAVRPSGLFEIIPPRLPHEALCQPACASAAGPMITREVPT